MTFSTTVAARQPQDIRTTESTPSSRVGRFAAAVRMAFATLAIVATAVSYTHLTLPTKRIV